MIKSGQPLTAHFFFSDDHEGLLPRHAFESNKAIRAAISKKDADGALPAIAGEISSCLDRLDSFLIQVRRVSAYADVRSWEMPGVNDAVANLIPESGLVIRGNIVCTDFESLLFHGRAALDRLMLFLSRQYGENSDRFSKCGKLLCRNAHTCSKARAVQTLLSQCQGISGILTDEGEKSLRSLLAHRSSIQFESRCHFAVWRMKDGRYLAFDCEAPLPVLRTTRRLAQEVPFLVLNTLAPHVSPQPDSFGLAQCTPTWKDATVVYSEFETSDDGLMLFSPRLIPDGMRAQWSKLRPEVLAHAFQLDEGHAPTQRVNEVR